MDVFGIDIERIVDLGTQVATLGALAVDQMAQDKVFERLVSIAVLIYETHPNGG